MVSHLGAPRQGVGLQHRRVVVGAAVPRQAHDLPRPLHAPPQPAPRERPIVRGNPASQMIPLACVMSNQQGVISVDTKLRPVDPAVFKRSARHIEPQVKEASRVCRAVSHPEANL